MEASPDRSRPTGVINPDLLNERRKSDLDERCQREITYLKEGGPGATAKRKEIESILFKEPCMDITKTYYQSDVEFLEGAIERSVTMLHLMKKHNWNTEESDVAMDLIRGDMALFVHKTMFIPALERLATGRLREKWLPLAKSCQIFGAYAQTELGHGTNLYKLETEARYDPHSQEFVISTPNLTSMKWWPGGLGKVTNFALVLSQLYVHDKHCGLHIFLVPIRSLKDHKPLPGVKIGAIGPRIGARGADNGYLVLNNVRIPRENMLMKYAEVTPEGVFRQLGRDKAIYGTMVLVRTKIVNWAYGLLAQSVTVALRYSAVRRQSQLQPGGLELQVLDYQTQQYKLFPLLALSYSLMFAKNKMMQVYLQVHDKMMEGDFSALPELHCLSSGLKAFSSSVAVAGIEVCRRCCGGHGYLNASGFPKTLCDALSTASVEGDNTVLYLQTARFLLKLLTHQDKRLAFGTADYLLGDGNLLEGLTIDLSNPEVLVKLYQQRARGLLQEVGEKFQTGLMGGQEQHELWNQCSALLVKIAEAYIQCYLVMNFKACLDEANISTPTMNALRHLFMLNALHGIVDNAGEFLETGAINIDHVKTIKENELKLLGIIRPNAIALVDAFDFSDDVLCSVLGSYDGDVYQRLFDSTKRDPLNKHDVIPAYEKHLKPLLHGKSKL